jgi:hypothetical protein
MHDERLDHHAASLAGLLHTAWCDDGLPDDGGACRTNYWCRVVVDRLVGVGVRVVDSELVFTAIDAGTVLINPARPFHGWVALPPDACPFVSSVSHFQRREDDAVAVFVHGLPAVTPSLGTRPLRLQRDPRVKEVGP